jgi:hypothetical protein
MLPQLEQALRVQRQQLGGDGAGNPVPLLQQALQQVRKDH